ncbi:ribonuclease domain-containing protein [Streptomyces sp. NPDC090127]|uniref:ribonuclease domain-containing protein n=1 Tax=Streptomyces sp. NPDC090127 TaxID=3365953 RepID=UPI00382A4F42
MSLRPLRALLALFLCVGVLVGGVGCSNAGGGAEPAPTGAEPAPTGTSGLESVRVAELPGEARATLRLIERGGPFPYEKDGATFGNFERVLPRHERGWYREYTVRTPGEGDRGARRLVTGRGGEVYYTDDHYETFREVLPDEAR